MVTGCPSASTPASHVAGSDGAVAWSVHCVHCVSGSVSSARDDRRTWPIKSVVRRSTPNHASAARHRTTHPGVSRTSVHIGFHPSIYMYCQYLTATLTATATYDRARTRPSAHEVTTEMRSVVATSAPIRLDPFELINGSPLHAIRGRPRLVEVEQGWIIHAPFSLAPRWLTRYHETRWGCLTHKVYEFALTGRNSVPLSQIGLLVHRGMANGNTLQ